MLLRIQGEELACHVGDVPGYHKALMFTDGDFDPQAGKPPKASITIPFDEQGWKAFQTMIANGTVSRIVPVGAEVMQHLPPPPRKMAVPRSR